MCELKSCLRSRRKCFKDNRRRKSVEDENEKHASLCYEGNGIGEYESCDMHVGEKREGVCAWTEDECEIVNEMREEFPSECGKLERDSNDDDDGHR